MARQIRCLSPSEIDCLRNGVSLFTQERLRQANRETLLYEKEQAELEQTKHLNSF